MFNKHMKRLSSIRRLANIIDAGKMFRDVLAKSRPSENNYLWHGQRPSSAYWISAGWALGATLDYGQRLGTALIKVAAGERVEAYRCEFSALVDDGALYAALCGGVVWTCGGLLLRYV